MAKTANDFRMRDSFNKYRDSSSDDDDDVSVDDSEISMLDESLDESSGPLEEEEMELEEEQSEEESEAKMTPRFPFLCLSSSDIGIPRPSSGEMTARKNFGMIYRRPVFLPKSQELLKKYEQQISYFSERMAEDQFAKQNITDSIYKYKYDIYEKCEGQVLEKLYYPECYGSINGLAFSTCGKYLGIGFGCGEFKICDNEGRRLYSPMFYGERSKILCVRHLPNHGQPIFVGSTRSGVILVCMYEYPMWMTWEFMQEPPNEINSFDVNMTGSKLVTGGKDATLRLYDFNTGKLIHKFKRRDMDCDKLIQSYLNNMEDRDDGHYRRIYAVKFRDEEIFLSGGNDNTVKIWDLRACTNPVQNIYGPHICGDALDILDSKILTGQWTHSESVEIWDLRTSRRLRTMSPKNRRQIFVNEFPYCCRFLRYADPRGIPHGNGDLIGIGGSGLGAMEVQSIAYNSIAHKFLEQGQIITLAQYENLIVYGTSNGVLGLCNFYSAKETLELDEEEGEVDIGEDLYSTELEEEQRIDEDNLETQSHTLQASLEMSISSISGSSHTVSGTTTSTSKTSTVTTDTNESIVLLGKTSSTIYGKAESHQSIKASSFEEKTLPTSESESEVSDEETITTSSSDDDGDEVKKREDSAQSNLKMLKKQKKAFMRQKLSREEKLKESSASSFGSSDSTDQESLLEYVSSDNSMFDFPSDAEFPLPYKKK